MISCYSFFLPLPGTLHLYSTQCNLCCFLDFIPHNLFLLWNMFFTYIPHPRIKHVIVILVPNATHSLYLEYPNLLVGHKEGYDEINLCL